MLEDPLAQPANPTWAGSSGSSLTRKAAVADHDVRGRELAHELRGPLTGCRRAVLAVVAAVATQPSKPQMLSPLSSTTRRRWRSSMPNCSMYGSSRGCRARRTSAGGRGRASRATRSAGRRGTAPRRGRAGRPAVRRPRGTAGRRGRARASVDPARDGPARNGRARGRRIALRAPRGSPGALARFSTSAAAPLHDPNPMPEPNPPRDRLHSMNGLTISPSTGGCAISPPTCASDGLTRPRPQRSVRPGTHATNDSTEGCVHRRTLCRGGARRMLMLLRAPGGDGRPWEDGASSSRGARSR